MAETAVEYIKGENYLTWYSDDPKWVNRIRQLADGNAEVQIVNDTGDSIYAHCPVSWFKSPKPPIKRNMTDEQRKIYQKEHAHQIARHNINNTVTILENIYIEQLKKAKKRC